MTENISQWQNIELKVWASLVFVMAAVRPVWVSTTYKVTQIADCEEL